MRIDHIAIWVRDLETTRAFYQKYFEMTSNTKYVNEVKRFSSYFLSHPGSNCRIELMHRPDITEGNLKHSVIFGITHIAVSVGSKQRVDNLTEQLRADGYKIVGEPRTTGDGYYESVIEDCEGNQVEITS